MGRPTKFNPELAERVCALVAEGKTLRAIGAIEGMPSMSTTLRWLISEGDDHAAFRALYARARESWADAQFERLSTIAKKVESGDMEPQAGRVAADIVKWQMGKQAPRKYGDSVTVKGDKDNPMQVRTTRELTEEELTALALGGLRAVD